MTKQKEPSLPLLAKRTLQLNTELSKLLDNINDQNDREFIKENLLNLVSEINPLKIKTTNNNIIFYNEFKSDIADMTIKLSSKRNN